MTDNASEPDELVIAVGSDDRYAIGLAVTLHSTLSRLDRDQAVRVIVIDGGIVPSSRRRLERVIDTTRPATSVEWHKPEPDRFLGLKVLKWGGSTAIYLRLLIPEIVDDSTTRVIYLDSDLLVKDDLQGLLLENQEGRILSVGAVRDYHHRFCRTVFGEEGCLKIGIDPDSPYFNSGVLVINVVHWREHRVAEKAVDFIHNHSDVVGHGDQDALNAVLMNKWGPIDDSWNVMISSLGRYLEDRFDNPVERRVQFRDVLKHGRILHFSGPRKPWLPGYIGPAGREYRQALYSSGWFDSSAERARWTALYWVRSPIGWMHEGYRRLRKRLAVTYRAMRPEPATQR